MTYENFDRWYKENCTSMETVWMNKIEYKFCTMTDNWIAIFEVNLDAGTYIPKIQAKDKPHAMDYCAMREPVTVPVDVLC